MDTILNVRGLYVVLYAILHGEFNEFNREYVQAALSMVSDFLIFKGGHDSLALAKLKIKGLDEAYFNKGDNEWAKNKLALGLNSLGGKVDGVSVYYTHLTK